MADDMNNGNGHDTRAYQDAFQAATSERITSLGRRQNDLESEMRSGFKQMEVSISGLANETRNSINALSSTMAERSRPQWQALSVVMGFAAILGGLAYWPIREGTNDLKSAVSILSEKMVTQAEMQWRTNRGIEDRQRTDQAILTLRDEQVPRKELERVWNAQSQRDDDLQRQITDLAANSASTITPRDALMDLRERLDRLERNRTSVP